MKIYIDTDTGSWGDIETLVVVDIDELAKESSTVATGNILISLASSPDSEICAFGKKFGQKILLRSGRIQHHDG